MTKEISNILFTRNRPLQLEAYLRSFYRFFPAQRIKTYIIYKVELFAPQYESVFAQFPGIEVIYESNFHRDILDVLSRVDTELMLFGIDDVVYFDGVDLDMIFETFARDGDDIFGFTMRFDPETVRNYGDELEQKSVNGQTVYRLSWPNGQTIHTRYPFELCSTIYRTAMVKDIISNVVSGSKLARKIFAPPSVPMNALPLSFKLRRKIFKKFGFIFSPNTLESWPCRWCQNNYEKLPQYIYMQKICASPIQVNMVNTSTRNEWVGTAEQTVEKLNEKYIAGYRFDIDSLVNNKPVRTDCGQEYFKLVKNNG